MEQSSDFACECSLFRYAIIYAMERFVNKDKSTKIRLPVVESFGVRGAGWLVELLCLKNVERICR